MAKMVWNVLICLVLATALYSLEAQASVTIRPGTMTFPVGMESEYFFVESDTEPDQDVAITYQEYNGTGAQLTQYSLQFDGQNSGSKTLKKGVQSFSFKVTCATTGDYYILIQNASATDFGVIYQVVTVHVTIRGISFESDPTGYSPIGFPTAPYKVSVKYPSSSTITLEASTPDSGYLQNNTVQIIPSTIVIPANSLSASFVLLLPTSVDLSSITFNWTVTAAESSFYTPQDKLTQKFAPIFVQRQIDILTYGPSTPEAVLGQSGNYYFYAYAENLPNGTVSVTPQAADTVFTPPTITFDSQNQVQRFTYTTTSADSTKMVNFYVDQDTQQAWYAQPSPVMISAIKRTVYVDTPSVYYLGNRTYMSISIVTPVPNSLTVSMYAAQLNFNQSSVTFSGNVTSIVVAITPTNTGSDQISFYVSGTDAYYYNSISPVSVFINKAFFITPDTWYVPTYLYVGQESAEIPIRCSISPLSDKGVTVTPVSDFIRFSPTSMTFRNGSEQAYFTATPLYTNQQTGDVTRTVTLLLSGPDAPIFQTPSTFQVIVKRRTVTVHWSDHLSNTIDDNRKNMRHLGKTYKVWVAANYIGEGEMFSVTPQSPYYRFDPAVMNFNEDNTRVLLEATVTGTGSASIDYVLGGSEGGWYAPITSNSWTNSIRPLAIERYQISPDTRLPRSRSAVIDSIFDGPTSPYGNYLVPNTNYFSLSQLQSYNVYSFVVRSYVLPDGGLTITPKCPHATFKPSSISLDAGDAVEIIDQRGAHVQGATERSYGYAAYGNVPYYPFFYEFNNTGLYIEANFTVYAQAGGVHTVTFELSGDDKGFYDRPNDQPMYFGVVERADNEPKQSAAGFVAPSLAVFAVAAAYALLL